MFHPARRAFVASCTAGILLAAGNPAGQTGQSAQEPQKPPVFRSATNFILVDVYPQRDGRIIEGLTADDFQVFEDGKAKAVESVEFVRIEANTPEAMRRDPASQAEGNKLAADPRNRVFILFLDHYHGSLSGSHDLQQPIVTMLNRLLTPHDLFGVATPLMKPDDLILGRQTVSIERQLAENWTWGHQGGANALEPAEQPLVGCYGEGVALQISARMREARTLESISAFMKYLGLMREARKVFMVFSTGWVLYEPDRGTLNTLLGPEYAGRPRVGIGPGGKISTDIPNNPGLANWSACGAAAASAFNLDNRRRFRDLIDEARQNNVAFYPVNMDGLTSDGRFDALRTLADNTDGFASQTNDFNAGLRRIADDVSAYYLLGYYSTNTSYDGKYRSIDVKVRAPGAQVRARPGYVAPTEAALTASAAAEPSAVEEGITQALGALSRLRSDAELFSYGIADPDSLSVVVELPTGAATSGWSKGATITVTPVDATGAPAVTATIEPGMRGALLRLPRPAGPGPFRLSIRAAGGGELAIDRIEIEDPRPGPLGAPLLFRAAPSPRAALRPAADFQFWRTERVHIEWPVLTPLDRRQGRLLGKDGRALAIPVNVTEREQNGKPGLAADFTLAALAAGDYILEMTVGAGDKDTRQFIPIRVVR